MTADPRPRSVTRACVLAGIGAAIVLGSVFSLLSQWVPATLRADLEPVLSPSGVSVDSVLGVLRLLLMAAAAGCVATIVLAVYTARRHAGARVALTAVTPVTAVASLVVGIADIPLIAASILCGVLLWDAHAAAWFLTPSERARPGAGPIPPPPPRVPASQIPKERPSAMSTPPTEPEGQPPAQSYPQYPGPSYPASPGPPPPPQYGSPQYGGHGGPVVPRSRPGTVTAAGVTTIVMAAITGVGWVVIGLVWAASRDQIERRLLTDPQFDSLNLTASDLDNVSSGIYVGAVLAALICLVAVVAAVLMLRGRNWARIVVVVLSAVTALLGLVFVLGGGFLALLWLLAGAAVIVLCFAGGAGAWFDARGYAADSAPRPY